MYNKFCYLYISERDDLCAFHISILIFYLTYFKIDKTTFLTMNILGK